MTHVSNKSNAPPHPTYWRRIPSPGGSFSLSGPITAFASAACQVGPHRLHGRPHSFPRSYSSQVSLAQHNMNNGTTSEGFPPGRAHSIPIKHDDNDQLASSSDNAVRHASEPGLGPVQNGIAPGSAIDSRQAGYYRAAGYPSAPMGNFAPQGHNRVLQIQNATTQSTGHDRTGVGGGRNGNIDAADDTRHASGAVPPFPPAEYPMPQPIPICKRERFAVHSSG